MNTTPHRTQYTSLVCQTLSSCISNSYPWEGRVYLPIYLGRQMNESHYGDKISIPFYIYYSNVWCKYYITCANAHPHSTTIWQYVLWAGFHLLENNAIFYRLIVITFRHMAFDMHAYGCLPQTTEFQCMITCIWHFHSYWDHTYSVCVCITTQSSLCAPRTPHPGRQEGERGTGAMEHTHACVVWWCNSTDLPMNYMYTQRHNGINTGIQGTYHRLSYTVCW